MLPPQYLLSDYLILNITIAATGWLRSWRSINALGFYSTFIFSAIWYSEQYLPKDLTIVEIFLALHFLLYVFIPIIFATKQKFHLKSWIDTPLVFGTPAVVITIQSALLHTAKLSIIPSLIGLSAFYFILGLSLYYCLPKKPFQILRQIYYFLSGLFITAAVPLILERSWTSVVWALEGVGVAWVGNRQKRSELLALAFILQLATSLFYISNSVTALLEKSWSQDLLFVGLALAVSHIATAYFTQKTKKEFATFLSVILFIAGILWWFVALSYGILHYTPTADRNTLLLAMPIVTTLIAILLNYRLNWAPLRALYTVLLPILTLVSITQAESGLISLTLSMVWAAYLVTIYFMLSLEQRHKDKLTQALHGIAPYSVIIIICTVLTTWLVTSSNWSSTWPWCVWGVVPTLGLMFLNHRGKHSEKYHLMPISIYLLAWSFIVNFTQSGNMEPLPYFPLLNPLDLSIGLTIVALFKLRNTTKPLYKFVLVLLFVWSNAILLRTFHLWDHIPFTFSSMYQSIAVQTGLTVFWSLIGLVTTLWASKKHQRTLWVIGATMTALVVLKLFFVDLASINTLQRVILLMGVSGLMLIIGYFSPVPPKKRRVTNASH